MRAVDRTRELALLALYAVTTDGSEDAGIAERWQTHETAAEAMSVLTGYLLEALSLHRGEDVTETARFVEHLIRRGPDDGLAGALARI